MPLPSLRVMGIAKADPSLFESLMAQAGFKIVRRINDPLSTNVQEEAVAAVASAITEDTQYGVRLSPYHRSLKTLAEQAGYVVMIENCGPPGADPCEGEEGGFANGMEGDDMVPLAEVGEGEALVAGAATAELPVEDPNQDQISQIAALPLGTELAAQVLAVINGEGTGGLDDGLGDEGLHGEMPMGGEEELPPEGGEELPPEPGAEGEFGAEEAPPEEAPAEGPPAEEEEGRPY